MRSQDVTQMYNNGKGGQDTLQTQFLEWYKKQIDQKIIEGKKSTITTDPNQTDPNQTDPNQRGGGDPDDDNDIRTNWSAVSSDDNSIVDGNLVRVKVGTRTMSVGDGPRTDYPNAQMVFRNGQAYFVTDNNVPITNNVSYSRNDAIGFFRNAYGISYTQAEEFVDAKIEQSKLIYKQGPIAKKYSNILNYDDSKITNIRVRGGGGSRDPKRYILDYRLGEDVKNLLGKHLKGLPVSFNFPEGNDRVRITYKALDGRKMSHTFTINRHFLFINTAGSNDERRKDEDGLINFLQNALAYDRSIARIELGLINESGQ